MSTATDTYTDTENGEPDMTTTTQYDEPLDAAYPEPRWRVLGRQWRELLPEGSYALPIVDFRHADRPELGHMVFTWQGGVLTAVLHLRDGAERTEANWLVLQTAAASTRNWELGVIAIMSEFIENPDRWSVDPGRFSGPGRVLAEPETPPFRSGPKDGRVAGFSAVPVARADRCGLRRVNGHGRAWGLRMDAYPRLTTTERRIYWATVAGEGSYVWRICDGERQLGHVLYVKRGGAVITRLLPDAGVHERELQAVEQKPEGGEVSWVRCWGPDRGWGGPNPRRWNSDDNVMADIVSAAAGETWPVAEAEALVCSVPGCDAPAVLTVAPRPERKHPAGCRKCFATREWLEFAACADHHRFVYWEALAEQAPGGSIDGPVIEYAAWRPAPMDPDVDDWDGDFERDTDPEFWWLS